MSESLVLAGTAFLATSGVPGLFVRRGALVGQWVSVAMVALGSVLGLAGVASYWVTGEGAGLALPWAIPGGTFRVRVDGLTALFLVPVFLIALLGSVYGLEYWKETEHPRNGRKLRVFYGLLPAGMALLLVAQNGLLFLVGWEVMALAAFFLVATEDHEAEVREAGWVYLVATHGSTLCLFALFAVFAAASGSLDLAPLKPDAINPSAATALFVLTLIGFGIKAGIMPLHLWLPSAHATAPSHVSAIMSGVLIKMGVYGIVRFTSLLPHPQPEWGAIVLGLGAISGVVGVAYALSQHDLKRLLAYHSIENIGIIVMGIGLAMLGRSLNRPDWIALGMAGALLHVWNHALFKSLLFLSAGSVVHATHTREIDHLGGLAKLMPLTALGFLVGAVAICGLPPLNGFVSEFLIYLGLFRTLAVSDGPALAAVFGVPALALIGTLAVACFVKVFGAVFLGTARSDHGRHAHESGSSMMGSMAVLAGCCFFIGLFPRWVAPALAMGVEAWAPGTVAAGGSLAMLAPLNWVSIAAFALLGGIVVIAVVLARFIHRGAVERGPTWGCGYLAPTERMQYTASSFAQMLVRLFAWVLVPRTHTPARLAIFPAKSEFHSEVPDAVLDRGVIPSFRAGAWLMTKLRVLQRGSIQAYLLYIFMALLVLLLWR